MENLKLQGSSEEQLSIARKRFQEFRQKNMSEIQEITQNREKFQRIQIEIDNAQQQLEKQTESIATLEKELKLKEIFYVEDNHLKSTILNPTLK